MLAELRKFFSRLERVTAAISLSTASTTGMKDERLRPIEAAAAFVECVPEAACVVSRYGTIFASNSGFKTIQHGKNILHHLCPKEHDRFAEGLLQQRRRMVVLERCRSIIVNPNGLEVDVLYDWSVCMYMEEILVVTGRFVIYLFSISNHLQFADLAV